MFTSRRVDFRPLRLLPIAVALVLLSRSVLADEQAAAIERRLHDSVALLAADDMEGRGPGTAGIDKAADYIAAQFRQIGLRTDLYDGGPFQKFSVSTLVRPGDGARLVLAGPQQGGPALRLELKPSEGFNATALSGSATFDLPLMFVGYGITAPKEKYDDYAGVEVRGKAVVVLRHEPQQADPKSVFNGTNDSEYAPFARKIQNAIEHGAAAVIFVTDEFDVQRRIAQARKRWTEALDKIGQQNEAFKKIEKPSVDQVEAQRKQIETLVRQANACSEQLRGEYDPLLPFEVGGRETVSAKFPVLACRRSVVEKAIRAATGTDLADLERRIDEGLKPQSRELTGWRAEGSVSVLRTEQQVRNVIAVCEGSGPLAGEAIVVGAHYDHIGVRTQAGNKIVMNGADDNASGTAALLEIARTVQARKAEAKDKPRRRVIFIAFSAEELGLLGSTHYVKNPLAPLESTVAMVNLDMVGRLRDDNLTLSGVETSPRFPSLVDALAPKYQFQLAKTPAKFGPSDQLPFYARAVPVLHFFTGLHADYHGPGDDAEKINVAGMRRISLMAADVVNTLAEEEKRPGFALDILGLGALGNLLSRKSPPAKK